MTCPADGLHVSHPCMTARHPAWCPLHFMNQKSTKGQQILNMLCHAAAPPPPSTMTAISTAAAKLLSKGAIAGIVIGVFFGVLIVIIMMTVTFAVLRRRASLQRVQVRMQAIDFMWWQPEYEQFSTWRRCRCQSIFV